MRVSLNLVGGKASSLYDLQDLNIPEWFVVSSEAFSNANCVLDNMASWKISSEFEDRIKNALKKISGENCFFAVRSSAVDEDGAGFSFAGQLDSFLGVAVNEICDRVIDVWKSAFSERIQAYRKENNLGKCIPPAVLIQKMVNADSAGVAFAVDPIGGYWDHAIVSSVWGLGSALVDGEVDADTWQVTRKKEICSRLIGAKESGRFLRNGRETEEALDDQKKNAPSLTDQEILAVATLARQCTSHHGKPQDIEWAFENGQLYLLQSRPITRFRVV